MATTLTPASVVPDDRFANLDLDGGPTGPGMMPPWASTAVAALRAAKSYADIETAIAPCRTQPEGAPKATVRGELARAKERVAASVRASLLATLTLVWVRLWGWMSTPNGLNTVAAFASAASVPVVPVTPVAPVASTYLEATWSRLRNGEWGARVSYQSTAPVVGDVVIVSRRNGASERKVITHVWWSDAGKALASVADAPAASTNAAADTRQPIPVIETPTAFENTATLADALGNVSAEATANATVQGTGSISGGQLGGVGFTSAGGYVTALAHGVKAATAESYKSTLRSRYHFTAEQIAALTVTIIPESTLPVGAGITHGPANSDAGIDAMRRSRLTRHGRATVRELQEQVKKALAAKQLIAGLITERSLLQWSWVGGGETTRGRVVEAFAGTSFADLAPGAPSAVRQAGDAVDSMRSREYDTARLAGNDLPDGVKARWIVGRKLTGSAVAAGSAYGQALLVVSLHDDGSLTFDGEQSLAAAIRTRYNKSTEHETLRSDVLTSWLGSVLKRHFYAVKRGAAWYVPAAVRTEAQAFCDALAPLWGDHETISVTEPGDVSRILAKGIRDEIGKLAKDIEDAITETQDRARKQAAKDNTNPETAARRASLTVETAAKLIKQGATVAARLEGYSGPLAEETITELRSSLTAAQKRLAEFGGDDSIARAAMLELS